MKCGDKIKYYRESINMTQDELAAKAGYAGRSAISRIESGERDISQAKIKLFANILGVSPVELLDDRDPAPVAVQPIERDRKKLFEIVEQLPADQMDLYLTLFSLPTERLQAIVDLLR